MNQQQGYNKINNLIISSKEKRVFHLLFSRSVGNFVDMPVTTRKTTKRNVGHPPVDVRKIVVAVSFDPDLREKLQKWAKANGGLSLSNAVCYAVSQLIKQAS